MVDNAWRDSFNISAHKNRYARETIEQRNEATAQHNDNSSLLELEKKANLVKPSGGDGIFAGTFFEPAVASEQSQLISKGLSIKPTVQEPALINDEAEQDVFSASQNKERRGKSIYNRATQVLETFAERLSSGGENSIRRKSSKEEMVDREKSVDSDRRKSAAPRVTSVVAKLSRRSRRKTKNDGESPCDPEAPEVESESVYSAANPKFQDGSKSQSIPLEKGSGPVTE